MPTLVLEAHTEFRHWSACQRGRHAAKSWQIGHGEHTEPAASAEAEQGRDAPAEERVERLLRMPELVTDLSSSELNNLDESSKDDAVEDAADALDLPTALAGWRSVGRLSFRATGKLSGVDGCRVAAWLTRERGGVEMSCFEVEAGPVEAACSAAGAAGAAGARAP